MAALARPDIEPPKIAPFAAATTFLTSRFELALTSLLGCGVGNYK
jgi:hypothetical protein